MAKYIVSGTYEPAGELRSFTKEVKTENEDLARERVYTNLGSKHRLKRTQIEINEVEKE